MLEQTLLPLLSLQPDRIADLPKCLPFRLTGFRPGAKGSHVGSVADNPIECCLRADRHVLAVGKIDDRAQKIHFKLLLPAVKLLGQSRAVCHSCQSASAGSGLGLDGVSTIAKLRACASPPSGQPVAATTPPQSAIRRVTQAKLMLWSESAMIRAPQQLGVVRPDAVRQHCVWPFSTLGRVTHLIRKDHNEMIHRDQEEIITAAQMRAARALLGLSQEELASRSSVSVPTLKRCESDGENVPIVSLRTRAKICAALEAAGIEFIPENGGGLGVRLARAAKRT
jgi:DNA-binding XRE family transcriptional regulator